MKNLVNKKIRGATITEYDGKTFKSKLEVGIYKYLQSISIKTDYEVEKILIWDSGNLTVPYFDKWGKTFQHIKRKASGITYTPDFVFNYKGITVFLEAKGFKNDVTPYKIKLFRKWLEVNKYKTFNNKVCFAVVYSVKNLKEFLLELDNLIKNNTFANEKTI